MIGPMVPLTVKQRYETKGAKLNATKTVENCISECIGSWGCTQWDIGPAATDRTVQQQGLRLCETNAILICIDIVCWVPWATAVEMLNHFLSPMVSIVSNDLCHPVSHHEPRSSPYHGRTQAITSTLHRWKVSFMTLKIMF